MRWLVTKVKVLSLFSGAGGLDLGLERAGMDVVALCEIDPKARAVLRRHWPATRIYEDVKEVSRERLESDGIERPDLVAGGSPCQDLSVAGKRRGLDGARSGLFWEQCRIADEYGADILWENVPGALSSNSGADFAAVLWGITGALVELPDGKKWAKAGVLVGPKRTAVWRVADAQRFGVPQRRRRVYVVGCSGAVARGLAPLLLEFQGGEGNRAASREAGTRAARTAQDGADDSGVPRAGRPGGLYGTARSGVTGAAYSTGVGWWNDADGKAGTLRAEGHPHESNLLSADLRNGLLSDEVTGTLMAHKMSYSTNAMPHVVQEPQAFVKVIRSGARDADGNLPPEVWREEPTAPTVNVFDNGSDSRSTVLFVQPTGVVSATGATAHALTASSSKGTTEDGTGRGVPVVSQPVEASAFFPSKFAGYDEGVGTLRARDAKGDANIVVQPTVASALTGNMVGVCGPDDNSAQANHLVAVEVAKTLTTGNQRLNPEHESFVVQKVEPIPIQGTIIGRKDTSGPQGPGYADPGSPMYTLDCISQHAVAYQVPDEVVPIAFSAGNAAEAYGLGISENLAPPLRAAASGSNQVPTVLYQDSQYGVAEYDTAGTLRAGRIPEHQLLVSEVPEGAVLPEPLAFTVKGNGEAWVQDMVTGITTGGGLPGQGYPAVIQPVGFSHTQGLDPQVSADVFPTLRAEGGGQAVAYVPFIAFTQNQREEVRDLGEVASALSAEHGTHQQTYIAQPAPNDDGE